MKIYPFPLIRIIIIIVKIATYYPKPSIDLHSLNQNTENILHKIEVTIIKFVRNHKKKKPKIIPREKTKLEVSFRYQTILQSHSNNK